MKHFRISGALLVFLIILGCSRDPLSGANDPKDDSWNLDYIGPSYMSGWVEHITVEDMKGRWFRGPGGSLGSGDPELGKEPHRLTLSGPIHLSPSQVQHHDLPPNPNSHTAARAAAARLSIHDHIHPSPNLGNHRPITPHHLPRPSPNHSFRPATTPRVRAVPRPPLRPIPSRRNNAKPPQHPFRQTLTNRSR